MSIMTLIIVLDTYQKLLIWGQKRLAIYELDWDTSDIAIPKLSKLYHIGTHHWIWDVAFIPASLKDIVHKNLGIEPITTPILAIGTSQNYIDFWTFDRRLGIIQGQEDYILYSLSFYVSDSDFKVATGTVFNKVVVWFPLHSKHCYVLEQHDGVIWRVSWSKDGKQLVSGGDDRTARLWSIPSGYPDDTHVINPEQIYFGHTARVWDCRFYSFDKIVTTGEDTTCILWDMHSGKMLSTFVGHEGRHVWSIDTYNDILVSGGSDSTIRLWELDRTNYQGKIKSFEYPKEASNDNIKSITASLNHGKAMAYLCMAKGSIYQMDCVSGEHKKVYHQEKSWCCSTLLDNDILAACNVDGLVHFFFGHLNEPIKHSLSSSRITMISKAPVPEFLQENTDSEFVGLFCATADAQSEWYALEISPSPGNLIPICKFQSKIKVPSKRAPTAVWSILFDVERDLVFVGDSFGSIHIYDTELDLLRNGGTLQSIYSKLRVHNRERVTSISLDPTTKEIITSGRDGVVNTFKLKLSENRDISLDLMDSVETKFSVINNIIYSQGQTYILGFSQYTALMEWPKTSNIKFEIQDHNGKTPYDFLVYQNDTTQAFTYVYGKSGKIHSFILQNPKPMFQSSLLTIPFHGRESNSIEFLDTRSLGIDDHLFVTTSEDTTLKVYSYNANTKSVTYHQTLKDHICATRTTCSIGLKDKIILFSGGGKLILDSWKLDDSTYPLRFCLVNGSQKRDVHGNESVCRIMDLSCTKVDDTTIFLVCSRSDKTIECYTVNPNSEKIELISNIFYHTATSLKVVPLTLNDELTLLIFAGSTKGSLSVWDVTRFKEDGDSYNTTPVIDKTIHQFSVDELDVLIIDSSHIILASGGHDQRLYVSLFKVSKNSSEQVVVEEISHVLLDNIHNAAVCSVKICDRFIFTSGPDQRLCVWEYKISNEELKVERHTTLLLEISDISSVDVKSLSSEEFLVNAVGKGMQITHFKANK